MLNICKWNTHLTFPNDVSSCGSLPTGGTTTTWPRARITNAMFNGGFQCWFSPLFLPRILQSQCSCVSFLLQHILLFIIQMLSDMTSDQKWNYCFSNWHIMNNLDKQNIISKGSLQPNTVASGPDSLLCHRSLEELFYTLFLFSFGSIIFIGGSSEGASMAQPSPNTRCGI